MIDPSSFKSPVRLRYRPIRSSERGSSLEWPPASRSSSWRRRTIAIRPRSGEPAVATSAPGSAACSRHPRDAAGRPGFPPLQRAQIVELACLEPVAQGLHLTHWSSRDLAREAVARGIVPEIADRTVRQILNDVDLQPHRTRYWRTARLDDQFKDRAEKVLWCYAEAQKLARRGVWVVCTDEMPNCQVLQREPIRRAVPGSIERQEFEYKRRGTVNVLVFLVVHSGRMEAACPECKDAPSYIEQLRAFRRRHRGLRGIYLIQDGDPSHTASATSEYLESVGGWWRPRQTPAHASWLNQAELLNGAFGRRYLKRRSFDDREGYIENVARSWPEYNRLYAHPFEWTWTSRKMRRWYVAHTT